MEKSEPYEIYYGIRNKETGKLVGVYASALVSDEDAEETYRLYNSGDVPWIVNKPDAERIFKEGKNDCPCCGYCNPEHEKFSHKKYEIVKISLFVERV